MSTAEQLFQSAQKARENAYAPYSRFEVGAAILTTSGKIYVGCNVENASYPAGICAECNAVSNMVSCGDRSIKAIAIVSRNTKAADGQEAKYASPCGICRQVLREFSDPKELRVITAISENDYRTMTLEELLPDSFGPESLG